MERHSDARAYIPQSEKEGARTEISPGTRREPAHNCAQTRGCRDTERKTR